jgi:hypothetical protein
MAFIYSLDCIVQLTKDEVKLLYDNKSNYRDRDIKMADVVLQMRLDDNQDNQTIRIVEVSTPIQISDDLMKQLVLPMNGSIVRELLEYLKIENDSKNLTH